MIHKRNLTITALVWAGIITIAFLVFPKIYHGAVGWLYFPSLALAVIVSDLFGGNPHSPSNMVGWSTFAVYTVFYWAMFLVVYVILLEIYLLRRVLHHLEDAKNDLVTDRPDSKKALEKMGQAIVELEAVRRHHLLLKPLDLPEFPTGQRHLLAAHVISKNGDAGPVKALLKKLKVKLAAETSPEKAAVLLGKFKGDASASISEYEAARHSGSGSADPSSQTPTNQ